MIKKWKVDVRAKIVAWQACIYEKKLQIIKNLSIFSLKQFFFIEIFLKKVKKSIATTIWLA